MKKLHILFLAVFLSACSDKNQKQVRSTEAQKTHRIKIVEQEKKSLKKVSGGYRELRKKRSSLSKR